MICKIHEFDTTQSANFPLLINKIFEILIVKLIGLQTLTTLYNSYHYFYVCEIMLL